MKRRQEPLQSLPQGLAEDRPRRCVGSTRPSPARGVRMHRPDECPYSTTVRRSDKSLPRRADFRRTVCARYDRPESTDAAEGNTAKDAFHRSRTKFRVNQVKRSGAAECPVRTPQPARRSVVVSNVPLCQHDDPREAVEPVRFVPGQPTFAAAALQAARRQIEALSQFLQRQPACTHHFADNRLRKAFTNGRLKVGLGSERSAKNRLAAKLLNDSMELTCHLSPR